MSAPPLKLSTSPPQTPTADTSSAQSPATIPGTEILSDKPSHDDSPLEPPPTIHTSGVASPSARTSFTRVDTVTGDSQAQPAQVSATVSQDREELATDTSPHQASSEQSSVSLQDSPESLPITSTTTTTTTTNQSVSVAPMASTTVAVDEPVSQKPTVQSPEVVPQIPQAFVTFLLVSGKRRTMSFEPETTIGRVKELIWNAWPSEWQGERPPAPSYLRVLYLGKMLQDDETLTKLKIPPSLPSAPQPTIVHLSIRPYGPSGEDGTIKKKRKNSDALTGSDDAEARPSACLFSLVFITFTYAWIIIVFTYANISHDVSFAIP